MAIIGNISNRADRRISAKSARCGCVSLIWLRLDEDGVLIGLIVVLIVTIKESRILQKWHATHTSQPGQQLQFVCRDWKTGQL